MCQELPDAQTERGLPLQSSHEQSNNGWVESNACHGLGSWVGTNAKVKDITWQQIGCVMRAIIMGDALCLLKSTHCSLSWPFLCAIACQRAVLSSPPGSSFMCSFSARRRSCSTSNSLHQAVKSRRSKALELLIAALKDFYHYMQLTKSALCTVRAYIPVIGSIICGQWRCCRAASCRVAFS